MKHKVSVSDIWFCGSGFLGGKKSDALLKSGASVCSPRDLDAQAERKALAVPPSTSLCEADQPSDIPPQANMLT